MNIELKNTVLRLAREYRNAHNAACGNIISRDALAVEAKAKKTLDDKVSEYNSALRAEYYSALTQAEKPFIEAIRQKSFVGVCAYKCKREKLSNGELGEKFSDVEVNFDGEEYFCLKKLDVLCPNGSWGHEASWESTVLALRLPLAAARAQATALDWKNFRRAFGLRPDVVSVNADYLPEASNDAKVYSLCIKLAHTENGISRTKATELLQYAINTIVFEDNGKGLNTHRVQKSDLKWLLGAMANYRNHGTAFVKADTMFALIFDVLGHVVGRRDYAVVK